MEKCTYTIREVAQMLGLCKNSVRKLLENGRLVSIRLSERKILIPRDSVEAFLRGE